jgi:hypothetical protein
VFSFCLSSFFVLSVFQGYYCSAAPLYVTYLRNLSTLFESLSPGRMCFSSYFSLRCALSLSFCFKRFYRRRRHPVLTVLFHCCSFQHYLSHPFSSFQHVSSLVSKPAPSSDHSTLLPLLPPSLHKSYRCRRLPPPAFRLQRVQNH